MARFNYRAHACALGGRVTFPSLHYLEPQAFCELPSTGGRVESRSGPYRVDVLGQFVLSYDSAETTITGEETPGGHSTTLTTTVRGLNVRDILKADEIINRIHLLYDLKTHRVSIDTSESRYVNLAVAGERFDVALDHNLSREAADYDTFRKRRGEIREQDGRSRHFLGMHPRLKAEGGEPPHHHHKGFGRIYFGEWTAAHKTQSLTMLRIHLGCPIEGDLDLGIGDGNGEPPLP